MSDKELYLKRILKLCDEICANEPSHNLSQELLKTLEHDYKNGKKIFNESEYSDPQLIKDIKRVLIHEFRGQFYIPEEITIFTKKIIKNGKTIILYNGLSDLTLSIDSAIGLERNKEVFKWIKFFLQILGSNNEVINADPLEYKTKDRFDNLIAIPPFGGKDRNFEKEFIEKAVGLLNTNGKAFIIFPEGFFFRKDFSELRKHIKYSICISSIISLPENTFQPITGIKSSLLILENSEPQIQTYMTSAEKLQDLFIIAEDYRKWLLKEEPEAGFNAILNYERWDVPYYEPIDFDIGKIDLEYKIVELEKLADISQGKKPVNAKIAINRTGNPIFLINEDTIVKERNNYFLVPKNNLNPYYLLLYLNSSLGQKAIKRIILGATIPYMRISDLKKIPIILPDERNQSSIINEASGIEENISILKSLIDEGNNAIYNNLFSLEEVKNKFKIFFEESEKLFYKNFPFPISSVYRKMINSSNFTSRFSLIIELFEVIIRFLVLVNLSDYTNRLKQIENIKKEIPFINKLKKPTLGDWISIFRSLLSIKSNPESTPFIKELKEIEFHKFNKTFDDFLQMRNTSLRGHGAVLNDDEYEIKCQEYSSALENLIKSFGFLSKYQLILIESMEKDGSIYKINYKNLMGDNISFENKSTTSRFPLDTGKVTLLDTQTNESLIIEPLITFEKCVECGRTEVLIYDKIVNKNIVYLSVDCGHMPRYPSLESLPKSLQEVLL